MNVPMLSPDQPPLLEIRSLSRHYGAQRALEDVDLAIEPGTVLGLVGPNGAGKTTLIRHVLGLLRAQRGSVRVFGVDPVQRPEQVLAGIGYVSEERDLPGWMRVEQLLRYTSAFYPEWDSSLADELCRAFALGPRQRVRTLSRGQHVRLALVLALAPRPPLLVLDEPSSGLDPLVRRDVLEVVLQQVVHEGRTVLFSSHLLDEVERLCDRLAMIVHGQVLLDGGLDDLLQSFARVVARRTEVAADAALSAVMEQAPGVRMVLADSAPAKPVGAVTASDWSGLVRFEAESPQALASQREAAQRHWRSQGVEILQESPAPLSEIFLRLSARPEGAA